MHRLNSFETFLDIAQFIQLKHVGHHGMMVNKF